MEVCRKRGSDRGWKNKKINMKNPAEWRFFCCLYAYLGDSRRYWLIPPTLSLNDLKSLLPKVVGMQFTNGDFHQLTVNLLHSLTYPTDHFSFTFAQTTIRQFIMSPLMTLNCSLSFPVPLNYKQRLSQDYGANSECIRWSEKLFLCLIWCHLNLTSICHSFIEK